MAFVSYTYNRYDPATKQYLSTIVDSDFGEAVVAFEGGVGVRVGGGVGIVKEYSKRGLPVGKNLALFVLYLHKEIRYSITDIKLWQDEYCPKYVENWVTYAKERDHHLTKLLALV